MWKSGKNNPIRNNEATTFVRSELLDSKLITPYAFENLFASSFTPDFSFKRTQKFPHQTPVYDVPHRTFSSVQITASCGCHWGQATTKNKHLPCWLHCWVLYQYLAKGSRVERVQTPKCRRNEFRVIKGPYIHIWNYTSNIDPSKPPPFPDSSSAPRVVTPVFKASPSDIGLEGHSAGTFRNRKDDLDTVSAYQIRMMVASP